MDFLGGIPGVYQLDRLGRGLATATYLFSNGGVPGGKDGRNRGPDSRMKKFGMGILVKVNDQTDTHN